MKTCFLLLLLLQIPLLHGQNILISTAANPNEPSIIMDPLHPNVLIAGANLNNYYVSLDTGRTWSIGQLTSSYGVWGDPAIAVDVHGDFYFFHLSNPSTGNWIDRIVCQKTTDRGQQWNDGTYTGLNGTKAQDKHWPVVDRNNNNIYVTWTQFDEYGSASPSDSSIILFSKSLDAGLSWSDAIRISKQAGDCIDSDSTVEGAVPAVGPDGEIYVAWAGPLGLTFNKSIDQGEHWLDQEMLISDIPGGWDYAISGIYRANGLPVTVCDLSGGTHHGTIYVNWSDQRNGVNNTDVWLAKSTDGGQSWSDPIKVNDDAGIAQQFFTYMAVDQTTGYLYFVFYDRREIPATDLTDVYIALSTDGGETFINRKISESPFLPNENIFFGDYTNITVSNGIVRPIWTRLNNGQLSIWTHLTTANELITSTDSPESLNIPEFETYPNPAGNYCYVSYKLHALSNINLTILNSEEKVVHKILEDVRKGYGKYVERIDLDLLHLAPGAYLVRLEVNGQEKTIRQIRI